MARRFFYRCERSHVDLDLAPDVNGERIACTLKSNEKQQTHSQRSFGCRIAGHSHMLPSFGYLILNRSRLLELQSTRPRVSERLAFENKGTTLEWPPSIVGALKTVIDTGKFITDDKLALVAM
jgi:hypothetical protein